MTDETAAPKRTRKPRDPDAPKAPRKPRPAYALAHVDDSNTIVIDKFSRNASELLGLYDALIREGNRPQLLTFTAD